MSPPRKAEPEHRPGDVWKTDSGNWRAMNSDGVAKTFPNQMRAKLYSKGGEAAEKTPSEVGGKGGAAVKGFLGRVKSLGAKAREVLYGAPEVAQKLISDPEHRKAVLSEASKKLKEGAKKTPSKLYHAAREEVKEIKGGIGAVKKLLRKPPEKITPHDKKALQAVAAYAAGAALTAATGGAVAVAAGFGKAFVAHVGIKAVSHMLDGAFTKFEIGEHALHGVHHLKHLFHLAADRSAELEYLRLAADDEDSAEVEEALGGVLMAQAYESVAAVLGKGLGDEDMAKMLEEAVEGAGSKESSLRGGIIRLAYERPELRPVLLPLIKG